MNNFLEASRIQLRIQHSSGLLSVEQLWQLSLTNLAKLIREYKKKLNVDNDDDLSFLDDTKKVDKVAELSFSILKEIYIIKKEEIDSQRNAESVKAHNEKIDAIIFRKQQEQLDSLSVDELIKMKK